MKKLCSVIGLALATQVAMADQPIPDAVAADPQHHTVEFENEAIRIIRIQYGPGETSQMHSHDATCAIFLKEGNMRMEFPDGSSSLVPASAPGTVECTDAQAHLPSNVGDTAVELVLVEMKGRKTAK